jgi:hypothetical protein
MRMVLPGAVVALSVSCLEQPEPITPPCTDASLSDTASPDVATADENDAVSRTTTSCTNLAFDAGPPTICSLAGSDAASLVVENQCSQDIDLWGISYPLTCPACCAEVFYAAIRAGSSFTQPSLVGQAWRLRMADAGLVVNEIASLAPDTTVVQVP